MSTTKVQTVSARQAAVLIGDRLGRAVTPKQVRSVARDLLPQYQDDEYTPHAYSKADVLALLEAFGKRASRRAASIAGSGEGGKLTGADVAAAIGLTDAPATSQDAPSATKGTATK